MRLSFTKMQGAGNDFVVLDETRQRYHLTPAHYRLLADRHFGVGADQILSVRPATQPEADFAYVIHNADGGEVEHCGNGARCFVRFVHEQGLSQRNPLRVQVRHGILTLHAQADGRVRVDMGAPRFAHGDIPFAPQELERRAEKDWEKWVLPLDSLAENATLDVAVLSMGNPHAVALVEDVAAYPVARVGPAVQAHPAFPQGVNVGFMQVLSPGHIRLRVYERGAGETLACGTGACAAVVAGIRLGRLQSPVDVDTCGGRLTIDWQLTAALNEPVRMTGPAQTVFTGTIELPDELPQEDAPVWAAGARMAP